MTAITSEELKQIMAGFGDLHVGIIGDFCLDIYWMLDESASIPSLETGKPTHPVCEQRYSPGGAGTVARNMVTLGCGQISAFGVTGPDPWGDTLRSLLQQMGVDVSGLLVQQGGWDTVSYTKPHVDGEEQSRFDFGDFNALSAETSESLLSSFTSRASEFDVVIVNEQARSGVHTEAFRSGLADVIGSIDKPVIVDSRNFGDSYPGTIQKINDHEATRLTGINDMPNAAEKLHELNKKPVFITRGQSGIVVRDDSGVHEVPGIAMSGELDTTGAGDAVLAGIAACLGSGLDALTAARVGNLAASVTVRKQYQTGSVTPEELLEALTQ